MIRPGTPDDTPAIAALIRELGAYERLTDAISFDEAALREHLFGDHRYAEVILAESGGETVGFALFFHNFSTFLGKPGLYLEDLYVRPEHRGRGHGKALFVHVARLAARRGCGRLEWSVLDWNEPAIQFYRSLGAQAMDGWTTYRLAQGALQALGTRPAT